jgi:hypothetical protein
MHVLLDANVPLNMWLHPVQPRPMVSESVLILDAAAKRRINLYVTPTIVANIYYMLHQELGKATAIRFTDDLLDHTVVIPQDEHTFRKALRCGWPDVEDASLYFAALMEPRITLLCTTNTKHFKQAVGLQVVTPAQLLKMAVSKKR